jgi:hypothetical protein
MRTDEPKLRITRRYKTLPLEAESSACADARFKVPFWNGGRWRHMPSHEVYEDNLQGQFEKHVIDVHQMKAGEENGGNEDS